MTNSSNNEERATLPDIGVEIKPRPENERIVKGSKTMTVKEHREAVRKAKVEAYNKGMIDAMNRVRKIRSGFVDECLGILEKRANGERLSSDDRFLLKLGMDSVTRVEERVVGKAKSETEVTHNVNIVNMIAGISAHEDLILDAEELDE